MTHLDFSADGMTIRDSTRKCFLTYRKGSGPTVEIYDIEVPASVRRKGIGRWMVNQLIDKHLPPGTKTVWAITRATNRIAQQFYQELRFRPVPLYGFYCDDPKMYSTVDAVMYIFEIGSQA